MTSAAPNPPPALALAFAAFRRGDLAAARRAAEAGLAVEPASQPLLSLAGLAAAQMGDPAGAISHFQTVLAADPGDLPTRINLAQALVAVGDLDRARAVCADGPGNPKLLRVAAYVHQQQGRLAEAAAAYEAVLTAFPDDFESWNNLGNVRSAAGDREGAVAALQQAIALNPDVPQIYTNLSEQLSQLDRFDARQRVMREAARRFPDNAAVQAELGLAEASMLDFAAAEAAYKEAIRLDPGSIAAWLDLGLVYENLNRIEDLAAMVAEADRRGLTQPEMGFIKAWALRRQGRFEEALPYAEATPETIHPVRRAQLLAELAERLGDPERAFAGYEEVNHAAEAAKPAPPGPSHREAIDANAAVVTRARGPARPDAP